MGAVENVKEIAEMIGKFHDIELNRRILKLEEEVIDLTRDKRRADEKVEELQRTLKFTTELKFKAPFYFADGDATPYCAGCWEAKKLAVHVAQHQQYGHLKQCPSCKHSWDPQQP
jgi:hypothetical protein